MQEKLEDLGEMSDAQLVRILRFMDGLPDDPRWAFECGRIHERLLMRGVAEAWEHQGKLYFTYEEAETDG